MTRDQKALVNNGTHLVSRMASRLKCMLPKSVDKEDLIAAGNLGLVKAALKFDPKRNVPFEVYARLRIRGEMQDYLRSQDPISRHARQAGAVAPAILSLEARPAQGREALGNTLEDRHLGPAQIVASDDAVAAILCKFKGRDRRILEMLFVDGLLRGAVACILGISESRVCVIASRLRRVLLQQGIGVALAAAS